MASFFPTTKSRPSSAEKNAGSRPTFTSSRLMPKWRSPPTCENCKVRSFLILLAFAFWTCHAADSQKPPTLADARAFMDRAESKLLDLTIQDSRADWVKSTDITYDTEILAAKADEQEISATMQLAKESTRFSNLKMPAPLPPR